jgi:hypothetical protein
VRLEIKMLHYAEGSDEVAGRRECWCHLEWDPFRNIGHSRESGNPVRRRRTSMGLRNGFPLPAFARTSFAGMTAHGSADVSQRTPLPTPVGNVDTFWSVRYSETRAPEHPFLWPPRHTWRPGPWDFSLVRAGVESS